MPDRNGHVLIAGASSGIGYALTERLVATTHVTAIARRTERLAPLADLGAAVKTLDVTELGAIDSAVKEAVAARGKLTGLVYCAGLQKIKPMRSAKPDDVNAVIATNLTAAIQFGAAFASRLVSTEDAVYCAVSSIAAARPEPGILPYAAAKAGLNAFVKGLAREAAPRRAVAVAPGWLDTEMTQAYGRIYDENFREALAKSSPLGIASIGDVVEAIAFLLSPAASKVTGVVLTVDAGASL